MENEYKPGDFVSMWRPPGEPHIFQEIVSRDAYKSHCDSAGLVETDHKDNHVYIRSPDGSIDSFAISEHNSPPVFTREEAIQSLKDYISQAEEDLEAFERM